MKTPDFTIKPAKEFGRVVTSVSTNMSKDVEHEALAMAKSNADYFKSVMDYITDVHWVKEPETQLGPIVDKLQRFRPIGWHAIMASKGYDELSQYFRVEFACREEHMPEEITWKFILKLILGKVNQ
jgi:hypothetical protein